MESKKKLLVIVSFLALASILAFLVFTITGTMISELNALLQSDYSYSVEMKAVTGTDDYYKYNAGIGFAVSTDATTGLNAEVIMQPESSVYTESVSWNADKLNTNELAVSRNLAKAYHLKAGDKLYSKHVVNGSVSEYTIKLILPALKGVRVSKDSFVDGVIIMGFDPEYCENITHNSIVFTSKSLEDLQSEYSEAPDKLLYRSDEILTLSLQLAPFVILYAVLGILFTIGFVIFMDQGVATNFRRQISLGFDKLELDRAYNLHTLGSGGLAIAGITIISIVAVCITGFCLVSLIMLFAIMVIEFVSLIITSQVLRKRFWRS